MSYFVDGNFTGKFSGRMGSHPVGHDHQMAPLPPRLFVFGRSNGVRILVVGPPHADVGAWDKLKAGDELWLRIVHLSSLRTFDFELTASMAPQQDHVANERTSAEK
jgi:hypothetical protein